MYNEENNYNAYENGSGTEERPASGSAPESANLWDTPAAEIPNPTGDRNTQSGSYTEPVYTSAVNVEPTYSPNHYGNDYGAAPKAPEKKPEKKKKTGNGKKWAVRIVGVAAAAAICAGASAGAATAATNARIQRAISSGELTGTTNQVVLNTANTPASTVNNENVTAKPAATGETMSVNDLYTMACQQVVGISITGTTNYTNFFGGTSEFAVSGSGFIISEDGYILTNYHVIEYGLMGYDVNVMLQDGTTYTAEIVGYEKENDVAVLKIDATGLSAATIGDFQALQVGDDVYCVGNPLGELAYSISDGIVSAKDRVINTDATTEINMFQLTAAVNHGNSGGPVYNARGEVVGIVTAKYSDSDAEGLGFAIPIDDAMKIAKDLIENGYVTGKAYMGIMVQTVEKSAIEYYHLVAGACVTSVTEGSAADNAGLEVGDIITAVDEQEITSSSELRSARRAYRAGDSAELTVYRNGDYITLTIVFDEEKQQSQTETENQQPQTQQPQTQQPQTQQPQETQPQTPEDGGQGDTWSYEIPDLFKDLFPGFGG